MTEHKLRPTCLETFIVLSSDVEMEDAPIFTRSEGEDEEEKTPKPKKKAASKHNGYDHDSGSESGFKSDSYKTPKAFKLKKRAAERAESLAESDVNSMDISKADSQAEGATESESEDAPKLVAQTHQHNKGDSSRYIQVITDQIIALQNSQRLRKTGRRSERM